MRRPTNRPTLRPEEVKQLLEVHRNTVYAMLRDGRLRGYKHRNKWYIYKTAAQAILDNPRV